MSLKDKKNHTATFHSVESSECSKYLSGTTTSKLVISRKWAQYNHKRGKGTNVGLEMSKTDAIEVLKQPVVILMIIRRCATEKLTST